MATNFTIMNTISDIPFVEARNRGEKYVKNADINSVYEACKRKNREAKAIATRGVTESEQVLIYELEFIRGMALFIRHNPMKPTGKWNKCLEEIEMAENYIEVCIHMHKTWTT